MYTTIVGQGFFFFNNSVKQDCIKYIKSDNQFITVTEDFYFKSMLLF